MELLFCCIHAVTTIRQCRCDDVVLCLVIVWTCMVMVILRHFWHFYFITCIHSIPFRESMQNFHPVAYDSYGHTVAQCLNRSMTFHSCTEFLIPVFFPVPVAVRVAWKMLSNAIHALPICSKWQGIGRKRANRSAKPPIYIRKRAAVMMPLPIMLMHPTVSRRPTSRRPSIVWNKQSASTRIWDDFHWLPNIIKVLPKCTKRKETIWYVSATFKHLVSFWSKSN